MEKYPTMMRKLKEYMQAITKIEINLKMGNDAFECYTCDFTHDYIDINVDLEIR